jgi:hypothetical protein
LLALFASPSLLLQGHAEQEFTRAWNGNAKLLTDALTRRDAPGVAKDFHFRREVDGAGFQTITGTRSHSEVLAGRFEQWNRQGNHFTPTDVTGDADGLLAETGTVATLDADGKEKDHSRYLIVWKREESEWRIHRDIVNSELAMAPKSGPRRFPEGLPNRFQGAGRSREDEHFCCVVMTAYGNDLACSVTDAAQLPYPNGSIILMEFAEALKDSEGKPLLDANGEPQKGKIEHVDVMRRGEGFGEAYGSNRSGQWEFAGYHLDGTYSTSPDRSASCAQCHQKAGAAKDFIFPLKAHSQEPTLH